MEELRASQGRIEGKLASLADSQSSHQEEVAEALRDIQRSLEDLLSASPGGDGITAMRMRRTATSVNSGSGSQAVPKMSIPSYYQQPARAATEDDGTQSHFFNGSGTGTATVGRPWGSVCTLGGDGEEHQVRRRISADENLVAPTLPQAWPTVLTVRPQLQPWVAPRSGSVATRTSMIKSMRSQSIDGRRASVMQAMFPRSLAMGITNSLVSSNADAHEGQVFLQFLREPDAPVHQFLDLIASFLIIYDLLIIPYALAWDLEHSTFVSAMDWILVSFWSMDVALSFVTGFHDDGELVMAVGETSRRYLRTWFLPDICMVMVDWFNVLLNSFAHTEDGHLTSEDLIRLAKFCKILRIIDVFRFLRIMRAFESFLESRLSNTIRVVLHLVSIIASVLYANHIVACIWFAVGRSAESDTGYRWLDQILAGTSVEYGRSSKIYEYATAYHWSIAQCTLSSMEVEPSNSVERVMICVCMLLGLLFGSGLISLLSVSLVEWRAVARARSQKISTLRNYLVENHVHKKVALFVQRQVTERLRDKGRLTAKDVTALSILSSSARRELHADITRPFLIRHPLFRVWDLIDNSWFRRLSAEAAEMTFLRPGDDLFAAGVQATAAYYLCNGKLNYTQEPDSAPVLRESTRLVEQGSWIAESALWSEWIFVGKAEAATHCQVLVVQSGPLLKAVHSHSMIRAIAGDYGVTFHKRIIASKPPISTWPNDIEVPFTDYGDIVASLGREVQVSIGMVALDHWKPQGGHYFFHTSSGKVTNVLDSMREEVADGKSIVVLTGTGEIERVVSVVVMNITNSEGKFLVQLGKWDDAKVFPDCTLPAVKRERGELSEDAAQRLINSKLAPLANCTTVTRVEREVITADSKGYGLKTKYMRKIYHASLTAEFQAPLCICEPKPMQHLVSALGTRTSRGSAMYEHSPSDAAAQNSHQPYDVYYIGRADKGVFCAWLQQEEFEDIKLHLNEAHIRHWMQTFRPPRMGSDDSDGEVIVVELNDN